MSITDFKEFYATHSIISQSTFWRKMSISIIKYIENSSVGNNNSHFNISTRTYNDFYTLPAGLLFAHYDEVVDNIPNYIYHCVDVCLRNRYFIESISSETKLNNLLDEYFDNNYNNYVYLFEHECKNIIIKIISLYLRKFNSQLSG